MIMVMICSDNYGDTKIKGQSTNGDNDSEGLPQKMITIEITQSDDNSEIISATKG